MFLLRDDSSLPCFSMYAGDTAGAPVDTTYSQASAAATPSFESEDK